MKVTLDKLTVTRVEMEMPVVCPECAMDFTEENSLQENQFVGSEQYGQLEETANGLSPDCSDGFENDTSPAYITGYACQNCGHVLVDTSVDPAA